MSKRYNAASTRRYDEWHRGMAEGEQSGQPPLQPWHDTVLRLLPDLAGKAVLEIGSGRGDFSIEMARRFPGTGITAIDASTDAVRVARSRSDLAPNRVSFVVADAQCLPFGDESFDFVVSCECLEHVRNPGLMAAEIARLLRPDGTFILTTENYFNGMSLAWLKALFSGKPFDSGSGVQPIEHYFLFWRVRSLLLSAGLTVDSMESSCFQWLLLPRVDPARLCTDDFQAPLLKRLFMPFGRHFTFLGMKR